MDWEDTGRCIWRNGMHPGAGKQSFGGLGATLVDTLDTLWLMDLKDEFQKARDWIVNELNFNK